MTLPAVKALVRKVCDDYAAPQIAVRTFGERHFDMANGEVARFDQPRNVIEVLKGKTHYQTILHELAHHIFATGHGPDFIAGMLELYEIYGTPVMQANIPYARENAPRMGVEIDPVTIPRYQYA
jgi:hypothetical protein